MTSGYRRPLDAAALAHNFHVFADADCVAEPLYAALSRAIADDDATLALLMEAPDPQRRPVLLFAAVHDLLLSGVPHALADFYRTCVGDRSLRTDDVAAGVAFVDLCRVHRATLAASMQRRTVQTNEVGRSAVLRIALSTLAPERALTLIDVGCSAGLNLLVDRYRFVFEHASATHEIDGPKSGVVIRASLVGVDPLAAGGADLPPIAARHGIDLAPLAVHDERDARWLRACVWPGDTDRHARLAGALALARGTALDLRRGEGDRAIVDLLDAVDPSTRPVVFHAWVVSYFERRAKHRFVDAVRAAVVERDAVWMSAEGPGVVPGLTAPPLDPSASAAEREATLWHMTVREARAAVTRLVARSHPHGRWIEWLDPARSG